jgi:hypothetical protein
MRAALRAVLGRKEEALVHEIELAASQALRARTDEISREHRKSIARRRPILKGVAVAAKKLLSHLEELNPREERLLDFAALRPLSFPGLRADLEALQQVIADMSETRRGPARERDRVRLGTAVARVLKNHEKKVAAGGNSLFVRVLVVVLKGWGLKDSMDVSLMTRSIADEADERATALAMARPPYYFSRLKREQRLALIREVLAAKQKQEP